MAEVPLLSLEVDVQRLEDELVCKVQRRGVVMDERLLLVLLKCEMRPPARHQRLLTRSRLGLPPPPHWRATL